MFKRTISLRMSRDDCGRVRRAHGHTPALRIAAAIAVACMALSIVRTVQAEEAQSQANQETTAPLSELLKGTAPQSLTDLKAIQTHVQSLIEEVLPTTVAVQVGAAQGSGVIISPEGYVLTAAHVSGEPGRTAWLVLHDGTRVSGTTLGVYRTLDAGLIKINQARRQRLWQHAAMGDSTDVAPGQWCLAAGHPGGFQSNRPPVVRLGRVLSLNDNSTITTDCTLIGGDSGGPLFDMDGKVIGVNSRIGNQLTVNLHVPVNTFRDKWDRLAQSDSWGHTPGREPFLGVQGEPESDDPKIHRVFPGTPAAEAGLKPGDFVLRFAGRSVGDFATLQSYVSDEEPGNRVTLVIRRDDRTLELQLVIGQRSG
ncbi:MAG: trypsin-like peptidase domain-containing protein [Planctomycetes bacterium]|nr:trypsin-like peptidase domain-containing protein [Planctomycetota bacterium]